MKVAENEAGETELILRKLQRLEVQSLVTQKMIAELETRSTAQISHKFRLLQ